MEGRDINIATYPSLPEGNQKLPVGSSLQLDYIKYKEEQYPGID